MLQYTLRVELTSFNKCLDAGEPAETTATRGSLSKLPSFLPSLSRTVPPFSPPAAASAPTSPFPPPPLAPLTQSNDPSSASRALPPSFLHDHLRGGGVQVSVLSKRPLRPPLRLGWCRIPASDVLDGVRPPSLQLRLSYSSLRPRLGGHGRGVTHVALRLMSPTSSDWCRSLRRQRRRNRGGAGWPSGSRLRHSGCSGRQTSRNRELADGAAASSIFSIL